ncbi:beta-catenin-like protein 1 [Sporobolomyces koalae]|uniref:beta-catenin-like protein 1 n=1 Tax=Sporobolomyces koalae TaxID=500713 RepID=UPI0031802893
MDIDEIFKRPPLPKTGAASASSKRKFEAPSLDPESYKQVKLSTDDHPATRVTIKDANDDDDDREGEFAPNRDADYFVEEDEDGRFFGGGLSSVQKQVLNIMDHNTEQDGAAGDLPGQELTTPSIKKMLLNLEKTVNKNRDLRTKFPSDPEKFVDSEFNLIETVHGLMILSSTPSLSFPLLVDNSTLSTLADLLSHENPEVSTAVIQVLEEYVDPDGLEGAPDEDDVDTDEEAKTKAVQRLVDEMVQVGITDLVVTGLERFDEQDEDHRTGVFHTLNLIENLLTLSPTLAAPLLSPKSPFLSWLYRRLTLTGKPQEWDQNRYYAAEMMSLALSLPEELVGNPNAVREARIRLAHDEWLEGLLKVLSQYRKRDASGADETEFVENVFDILCTCLSSSLPLSQSTTPSISTRHPVKQAFLDNEGIELMLLLLKSNHQLAKTRALKCLAHALQGLRQGHEEMSVRFVDCLGLKTLFAIFMGKGNGKKNSNLTAETTEHLVSIMSSLFTSLPSDSQPRLRLLTKFIESGYSKLDRLSEVREEIELRMDKAQPLDAIDMTPEEKYLEKLENGGMSLQLCDYVAAWICMEDDGAREHYEMLLSRRSLALKNLVGVLQEYRDNIDTEEEQGQPAQDQLEEPEREPTEALVQKGILTELVAWLDSVA